MATQISIRPIGDLAEHARLQERCAGRLDARALRSALASPGADAEPGDELSAFWHGWSNTGGSVFDHAGRRQRHQRSSRPQ